MRIITLIIIHCSAVRPWQQSSVEDIDRWHRARGWKNGCGYLTAKTITATRLAFDMKVGWTLRVALQTLAPRRRRRRC